MKKFYSALLIISFFFVFTISAHAKSITISWNGKNGKNSKNGKSNICYNSYKNAKHYKVGACALNQTEFPVTDLEINWISGHITVVYHNKNTIKLSEESQEELKESEMLHYLYDDGKLTVQFCEANYHYKKHGKNLIITLPENLKLNDFSLDVTSALFQAENLATNNFNADLTSGTINVSFISDLENLNVDFTSGDVNVTAPYAEKINCDLTSGDATFTLTKQAPESINVDATSGDLNFTIPDNDGFTVSIDKTAGSFKNSGFAFSEFDRDTYYYGNAQKRKYNFDITSGEIVLKKF